jgi:hypothetical protein
VRLILHHPFVDWDDLLSVDSQVYIIYIDAFHACTQHHIYLKDFYMDIKELGELGSDSDTNSDDSSDEGEGDNYPLADFEIFAHWRSQDDFFYVDTSEGLSYQDINHISIGLCSSVNTIILQVSWINSRLEIWLSRLLPQLYFWKASTQNSRSSMMLW